MAVNINAATQITAIRLLESGSPGTPASTFAYLYSSAAGIPTWIDDAGNVYILAGAINPTTIELGHASDTTLARVSSGLISVEGKTLVDVSTAQTMTNKTLTAPVMTAPVLGTPASGVATNLTSIPVNQATGALPRANAPTGSVVQVVFVSKVNTFSSSTATTWTAITDMSLSITPTDNTNAIVLFSVVSANDGGNNIQLRYVRDSTAIGLGTGSGSRTPTTIGGVYHAGAANESYPLPLNWYDLPATTSALTYTIQFFIEAGAIYVNRTPGDGDFNYIGRSVSTMIAMEVVV